MKKSANRKKIKTNPTFYCLKDLRPSVIVKEPRILIDVVLKSMSGRLYECLVGRRTLTVGTTRNIPHPLLRRFKHSLNN